MVPLFIAAKKAVKVRVLVDDTLKECGLHSWTKETIKQRVLKLFVKNQNKATVAQYKVTKLFCRLYKQLSVLANNNNNVLWVDMKLFSITEQTRWRLVWL